MITIRRGPEDRILELGGGSHPQVHPACLGGRDCNVDVRMCQNDRGQQTTDFSCDFNAPLPIQDNEWDAVFSHFVLEHVSWRKVLQFISEMLRVCKPGGKVVCVTADTEAQVEWLKKNPNGWDGKDFFESASCILYGDQDYPENSHRCYFTKTLIVELFSKAGWQNVTVTPYGARDTDMVIQATKAGGNPGAYGERRLEEVKKVTEMTYVPNPVIDLMKTSEGRKEIFSKSYFNGGGKYGGLCKEIYRDFPFHEMIAGHVLALHPESVLELGCARGYILKRLQDRGIRVCGVEISKHAHMTRVCEDIVQHDLCQIMWPFASHVYANDPPIDMRYPFDLCFSMSVLEHIPEEFLPAVLGEIKRTCRRGLHGIDFGENDDGFDQTRVTLKPRLWWNDLFRQHKMDTHVIVDRDELKQGQFPVDVLNGDGKVKLNIGSFICMAHHGWENLDILDQLQGWSLSQFAQMNGYRFTKRDVREGLPHKTGEVDLIHASHFLEHLDSRQGLAFLRDCRRVLKSTGAMRIIVPDAKLINQGYLDGTLGEFDEVSDGCSSSPTVAGKLWELLFKGHEMAYDKETLCHVLNEAGFDPRPTSFRQTMAGDMGKQILKETLDLFPSHSLFCDAVPRVG